LTVTFTDTSTGNPVTWNWNFGDGSTATTRNPSHTFTNAGNFTVALTVTAEAGQSSSASHVITVTNGSQNGLPLITLQATQPDAYESGAVPGEINFHRTGDTSQAYEVFWSFSGTASNGVDFEMLPTDSPFPEGLSDATLTITPIDRGPGLPGGCVQQCHDHHSWHPVGTGGELYRQSDLRPGAVDGAIHGHFHGQSDREGLEFW
jgi:PKD repeat protein